MVSKRFFIVMVVVAFLAGAASIYFFSGNTVTIIGQQQSASSTLTAQAPKKAACDGPSLIAPEDLYAKRSVNYTDTSGITATLLDKCIASGQVSKTYCYENPGVSGNFVAGQVVYDCSYGCNDGACKKPQASSTFAYPYPVVWKEGSVELSVTGAFWGTILATPDFIDGTGKPYAASSTINALVLYLKVSNLATFERVSVPMNISRVADEQGNLKPPATRAFTFLKAGGDNINAKTTYLNQKVVFVVPEGEKSFVFTTGGSANIFFAVMVGDDGTIKAQEEPTSEGG